MSWRAVEPTPFRGWIRWAPKSWPAAERAYLDLAALRVVWPGEAAGAEPPRSPPAVEPDVAYLPPATPQAGSLREALVAELVAAGHVVAAQLDAGRPEGPATAALQLIDPTAELLRGELRLPRPPFAPARGEATDVVALVPLLPGLYPRERDLEALLDALAELEPTALLPATPELSPQDRRRLVRILGDDRFEAVFHGRPPEEREVARGAAQRGLRWLPERPIVGALSPRVARNREIASALIEAGELWLRLGRRESEGVALLAAARRVEELAPDVKALALEGNLGVLDFLSATARRVVGEAATGEPGPLAGLRADWCAPDESGAGR